MSEDLNREQCDKLIAEVEDVKAKLDAGTHHIVDGELVEK